MSLSMMRQAIEDEGLTEVGISFVGGVTYMLTFNDKVAANTCMELNVKFFNTMFSKYYLWLGDDIPFSRLATLKITGVPFLIRDNNLFDNIGGLFGEVIQKSSFSWQEEDNSSASIKILTSQPSKIDQVVVIKWNNRTIAIWVAEYDGQWQPDRDDVSLSDSQGNDYESSSDSDMDSEEADDLEEGEIKQSVDNVGRSQDEQMDDRSDSIPVNLAQKVGN
ncbi:hypothetical protein Hanom_Chr05g00443271 [Helianthus anomalus]